MDLDFAVLPRNWKAKLAILHRPEGHRGPTAGEEVQVVGGTKN